MDWILSSAGWIVAFAFAWLLYRSTERREEAAAQAVDSARETVAAATANLRLEERLGAQAAQIGDIAAALTGMNTTLANLVRMQSGGMANPPRTIPTGGAPGPVVEPRPVSASQAPVFVERPTPTPN